MSDRNETPHLILQELGLKKCNGDVDSATENITIEQIKSVVGKQKSKLTGIGYLCDVQRSHGHMCCHENQGRGHGRQRSNQSHKGREI